MVNVSTQYPEVSHHRQMLAIRNIRHTSFNGQRFTMGFVLVTLFLKIKKRASKIHGLYHAVMNYGDGIVLGCMVLFLMLFVIFSEITPNKPIKSIKKSALSQVNLVICTQSKCLNTMIEYVH